MHIAVLVTNTDESEFAARWPKDDEKFISMMQRVRPDWRYSAYWATRGELPESFAGIDGLLITGSPASVNSGAPWIAPLLALLREAFVQEVPMVGACFGHQAIAKALGGAVGKNPGGWVHGLVDVRFADGEELPLYASHSEQVLALPEGAEVIAEGPGCAVAGFRIGRAMTTQYHPEMAPEFIAALTEEIADELPGDVIAGARKSLSRNAEMDAMAERMARFFEGKSA